MAKQKDFFGFEELEKALTKMKPRYQNEGELLLAAFSAQAKKRARQLTPRGKTGNLRKSWRLKKTKYYRSGLVLVNLMYNKAPHGHLVNDGHDIVVPVGKKERRRVADRKRRAFKKQIAEQKGIAKPKRVAGQHFLEKAMAETKREFYSKAEKLLESMMDEVDIK